MTVHHLADYTLGVLTARATYTADQAVEAGTCAVCHYTRHETGRRLCSHCRQTHGTEAKALRAHIEANAPDLVAMVYGEDA